MVADWIEVWRKGVTSPYVPTRVRDGVPDIATGHPDRSSSKNRGGITLTGQIPSKGGGTTKVYIWVPPSAYGHLAALMLKGAPEAAEKAFLKYMSARRSGDA